MKRWWHDNAERPEKNVHPDPSGYGIDLDHVRAMFADYTKRMGRWTVR